MSEIQLNVINDKGAKDMNDEGWGKKQTGLTLNEMNKGTNKDMSRKSYKCLRAKYKYFRQSFRREFRSVIFFIHFWWENMKHKGLEIA